MELLRQLQAAALSELDQPTFTADSIEVKPTRTGNVGFRATCTNGTVVTFWASNMERVVEQLDDNTFRVIPGTEVTVDGSLIPKDAESKGFWSQRSRES